MAESEVEQYKETVSTRLSQLSPFLQKYALGDFSESIEVPGEEDEFTELLVGLRLMVDEIKELIEEKESTIVKLKRAEEALQESELRYRTLFENAPVGIGLAALDGRILACNDAICQMTGYSGAELGQINLREIYRNPKEWALLLKQLQADGYVRGFEVALKRKDGIPYYASLTITPLTSSGQDILVTVAENITERKQAEEAIRLRTEDLALISALNDASNRGQSLQEIVALLAQEARRIFSGNGATVYLLSEDREHLVIQNLTLPPTAAKRVEKLIGMGLPSVRIALQEGSLYRAMLQRAEPTISSDPETVQRMMAEVAASDPLPGKVRQSLQKLVPQIYKILDVQSVINVPLVSEGEAIGLLGISRHEPFTEADLQRLMAIAGQLTAIVEHKRAGEALQEYSERLEEMVEERTQALRDAQEQLVRQERLAVLGQLAGSLGHELRNPLGGVKNVAYFLNMVLEEPDPEVKESLEILEKEVGTCDWIISSLLDFARVKSPARRKADINDILQTALSRIAVPENVKVVTQLDESLPIILADPDQLAQVFGNIILNGIQAMSPLAPTEHPPRVRGGQEGGRLIVKTEVSGTGDPPGRPKWVTVSFTDTGVGIPQENLEKIFEPLFTTKAKGIGLGLALVKTLVEGHEGTIEVKSQVGKGSTFTVKLPVSKAEGKER